MTVLFSESDDKIDNVLFTAYSRPDVETSFFFRIPTTTSNKGLLFFSEAENLWGVSKAQSKSWGSTAFTEVEFLRENGR